VGERIQKRSTLHDHDRPVLKHGPRSPTCVQVLTEIKHRNAKWKQKQ